MTDNILDLKYSALNISPVTIDYDLLVRESEIYYPEGEEPGGEEEEENQYEMIYNFVWPLPDYNGRRWKGKTPCMAVYDVKIINSFALALIGGGMDFSWEIAESYMNLGYYPPYQIATNFPRMAVRGESENDKRILRGLRFSLDASYTRSKNYLERFDDSFGRFIK